MNHPLRWMFIIIGSVAVVLAGAVGGYEYLKTSHKASHHALTPAQARALQLDLEPMTTDLKGDGLIQFSVTLQASDSATKQELNDLVPQIQDLLNATMRQYTAAQLRTSAGMAQLRADIRNRINRLLTHGRVTEVYLPQIIVQ
ncbi:hypothetical protein GCM10010885_00280 [Alicyclobacillus cellulosilyticus]|uniref:Flagellar protein FliL n=1 Tax=Alicyclobacillus cellulosilyticus TaxID=1003997 RepID=A0A917K0G2_9BACL|nr:flagellar basal body-associated FliL family protein [Alicyclobacillus cellulosilyticus]GGI94683.1 hypothetical protein GCM10010885_00280 [Alicyclobacillus cellulosilyticus]